MTGLVVHHGVVADLTVYRSLLNGAWLVVVNPAAGRDRLLRLAAVMLCPELVQELAEVLPAEPEPVLATVGEWRPPG